MVKEGTADTELDGETRYEGLLEWPEINGQPIETSGEGWGRPLSCSGIIDADNNNDNDDDADDDD